MEETLLERCESIDMLRIIENGELVRMVRLSSCVEEHTRTLGDYERMAAENPRLNDYFIPVMIVRESYKKMQERVDKIFEDYDRIAEASSTD